MLDRISTDQRLQICKWLDGLWSRYNHSTKSISAIFPQMCFKTEGHQDIGTNMFMCKVCDVKLTSEVDWKNHLGGKKHRAKSLPHDVAATCPTSHKVFNSSKGKKAKQNSMEQHQQVRIFFVELKYLEIIEFRCTGPRTLARSIPAPFVECRDSGSINFQKLNVTKTPTGLRQMLCST